MTTADVVIIGGGIVGSSIAYHLTAAGCNNVLVIERETRHREGIHRQEHGRRSGAVFDACEHPDVAVLDSFLCEL